MPEQTPRFIENGKRAFAIITGIFLIAILLVFPIYYRDYYFDILDRKYQFYYISVIALAGASLITALAMLVFDLTGYSGKYTAEFLKRFSPRQLRKTLSVTDWALLAFLLVALCSTLCSDYLYESFWGNEGRYTGLFLLMLYGISFYIISRLWNFKSIALEIFLVASFLVCAFGITDYFNMDLLGFKRHINPAQYNIFMSFMGNINTYTAYISLVLGVAGALYGSAKTMGKCLWYYICLVTAMFAIVTGQSDNAYLALAAMFGLMPFYLFRTWTGIRRYAVILASFFTVIQAIDWISQTMGDKVLSIDGVFSVLVQFGGLAYIVIALWLIVGVLYAHRYFIRKEELAAGKWPCRIWGGLIAVCIAALVFLLLDANAFGNSDRYGSLGNYLVFGDEWGTHRGYIWRIGLENYKNFSPIHKIFGYGPDTFGIITVNNNYSEMTSRYGEIFDSAHNEYLQYFVTIGPLGLLAYLTFLGSAIVRMVRKGIDNPYIIAAVFATICYGAQAFVNINLPIATPVMWTILMVGMAGVQVINDREK